MPISLTESMLNTLDTFGALYNAKRLQKNGSLKGLSRTADGGLLFGQCQGSGKDPYNVSIDLDTGAVHPTMRCSCPSRQHPCKHALAMAYAYTVNAGAFAVKSAPKDLIDKREKLQKKNAKSTEPPPPPKPVDPETQKKRDEAAQKKKEEANRKKTSTQKDTLEALEKFTIELVMAGVGGLTAKQLKNIQDQSNRVADSDLPGPRDLLRKLLYVVEDDSLTMDLRHNKTSLLLTQLWATVRKGQKLLEEKLEEGDNKADNDDFIESVLGRRWQLTDLKTAGYFVRDRALLELAHERIDDKVLDNRIVTGYLLDLEDGSLPMERSIIPEKVPNPEHRQSFAGVAQIKEAALYPSSAINRRIRWDKKEAGLFTERERTSADYKKLHQWAKPIETALKSYKEQLKNVLLPQESFALLAADKIGHAGKQVVLVDAQGQRLPLKDMASTFKTTDNLIAAAGGFGAGSVVVRLWFDLLERVIYGQPLALIVGEKHLRLGM